MMGAFDTDAQIRSNFKLSAEIGNNSIPSTLAHFLADSGINFATDSETIFIR
jgi:hypothetical protein